MDNAEKPIPAPQPRARRRFHHRGHADHVHDLALLHLLGPDPHLDREQLDALAWPEHVESCFLSLSLSLSRVTGALFRLYQPGLPLRAVRLLPGLALLSACCHRWLTKGG